MQLSIDDFGTVTPALAYLRHLPIGELKIDRSFVKDLKPTRTPRRLSRPSWPLAHLLGLSVVAEGVKPTPSLPLAAKGCGYVQGWWLAKSMPAAELERWMAEYDIGAVAERISQAASRAPLLGWRRSHNPAPRFSQGVRPQPQSSATTSGRFGERLRPPAQRQGPLIACPRRPKSATRGKHGRQLLLGIHRRASLCRCCTPCSPNVVF